MILAYLLVIVFVLSLSLLEISKQRKKTNEAKRSGEKSLETMIDVSDNLTSYIIETINNNDKLIERIQSRYSISNRSIANFKRFINKQNEK